MKNIFLKVSALLTLLATCSIASAISISPIKTEILPKQRASVLNLTNESSFEQIFDVQIRRWTGTSEQGMVIDEAIPDSEAPILLSKPIVRIGPKEKAIIRLSVSSRSQSDNDYYRIIVKNITPPERFEANAMANAAEMNISYSLPMEVRNTAFVGQLTEEAGLIKNTGRNMVAVLGARRADGTINSELSRYVFPGTSFKLAEPFDKLVWLPGIQ